jgi:hypothetical protein
MPTLHPDAADPDAADPDAADPAPPRPGTARPALPPRAAAGFAAVVLGAFAVLLLIGSATVYGNWADYDEREFHRPLTNHFLEHGVSLDFPTMGATTPGTHLLVAGLARAAGIAEIPPESRFVDIVFAAIGALTLGLLALLCRAIAGSWGLALALTLPVLSSTYFLLPSTYLMTEGLAYLGYTGALAAMLLLPHGAAGGLLFALAAGAMVLSRQVFLPAAFVYAAHALPLGRLTPGRLAGIAAVLAVPCLLLAPIFLTWGGLVPEQYWFHEETVPNWPVLMQTVALAGILAVPFLAVTRADRRVLLEPWPIAAAVAAGLFLWIMLPTEPGRPLARTFSVVWHIADVSTLVLGRPVLVLGPLLAGCLVIAWHLRLAWQAGRVPVEWIMLGLYAVALSAQTYAWQRYAEIPLLITLAVSTAFAPAPRRWGLAVLVGAYGLYLGLSLAVLGGVLQVKDTP